MVKTLDVRCLVWFLVIRPPDPLQMRQPLLQLQGMPRSCPSIPLGFSLSPTAPFDALIIILLMTSIDGHSGKVFACFVHNKFSSTELRTNVWMVHRQTRHVTDIIGVNRPAFGGTVPHFHQMSRVPRNGTDVPHFF